GVSTRSFGSFDSGVGEFRHGINGSHRGNQAPTRLLPCNPPSPLTSHPHSHGVKRLIRAFLPGVRTYMFYVLNVTEGQRGGIVMHCGMVEMWECPPVKCRLIIGGGFTFVANSVHGVAVLLPTQFLVMLWALITLTGICIYIAYSASALENAACLLSSEILEDIDIRFGWSLALAWISFITEVLTGIAFLLAARITGLKRTRDGADIK
ncbi:Transmembrane 114, partial, partial [Pelobates cultripes]